MLVLDTCIIQAVCISDTSPTVKARAENVNICVSLNKSLADSRLFNEIVINGFRDNYLCIFRTYA